MAPETNGRSPHNLTEIYGLSSRLQAPSFQEYVRGLLEREQGLEVRASADGSHGEFDLVLWNTSSAPEIAALGNPLFAECRWLDHPLDEAAIAQLAGRIRERGLSSGLLVCNRPISAEAASLALKLRGERLRLVLLGSDDLQAMERGESLRHRVEEKLKTLTLAA